MSFDPNLPQAGTEMDAVQMRSQFNGLKALIDAIATVSAVEVDGVDTLPPGSPATVTAAVIGSTLHFSFGLPDGAQGPQGMDGPQGPPFGGAQVDAVTTVDPGQPANVSVSFDGHNVRFSFDIPRGDPGPQEEPGPPGDVNQSQLDTAISGTSNNSNNVATLGLSVTDPPQQTEVQQIADKLDELIQALRR